MDKHNEAFKEQENISFITLIIEIPDFILRLAVALFSGSTILLLDAFDSLSNLVQTIITYKISKRIQKKSIFEYDYGVGKFESFGSFISLSLMYLGFLVIIAVSIHAMVFPQEPSDIILVGIIISVLGCCFDIRQYIRQKRLLKKFDSKLFTASMNKFLKDFILQVITILTLILILIFKNNQFIVYFESIMCIGFVIVLFLNSIKTYKLSIYDLLDKTTDEDVQMKILRAVTSEFDSFDSFKGIRSRYSGNMVYIDLLIGFAPGKTVADVETALERMSNSIKILLPNSIVSIIFTEGND